MDDFWCEISQDLYEKGYMDRYSPPVGTPPGVATGYVCPAGWEMRDGGRWYCKINWRNNEKA
jgi:hypothetical protein